MIVALIALFVATGAVTTTKIKAKGVTAVKVATGAIGTDQLAAGAMRAADLGPGAVGTPQLAAGAVGNAALANGSISEAKIANGAVSRSKLASDAQIPALVVRRSAPVDVPNGMVVTATASCRPRRARERWQGASACRAEPGLAPEGHGGRAGPQRGRRCPDRLAGLRLRRRHGHAAGDRLRDLRPRAG